MCRILAPLLILLVAPLNVSATDTPRTASFPTKAGTYESGPWKYIYHITSKGSRSERRHGQLFQKGLPVPGTLGDVRDNPLGRFVYFGDKPQNYSRGWLNTLSYDKPVFDKAGKVIPELAVYFKRTAAQLIKAATTRPWPGKNIPELPALSTAMREKIAAEIQSSTTVQNAYEKLDASNRRNVDWFEGVAELEKQKAIWSLLSCLCHPHEDVQIHALRSLGRLKDKRAVPFLLVYADYMAVWEGGSENATIHGVIHQSLAKTMSDITGIEVALDGQDPDGLNSGVKRWRKWLVQQDS